MTYGRAETWKSVLDLRSVMVQEADVDDSAMWSHIDFQHPLFLPFADPRFNDFTKIRVWKHRLISSDPRAGLAGTCSFR